LRDVSLSVVVMLAPQALLDGGNEAAERDQIILLA
jgi:hypothetical protein